MIRQSRLQHPDPERTRRTGLGSTDAFRALLRRSVESPDDFWAEVAGELEWMRRWDTVYDGDFPHFRFFTGGVSNPTINLLDRHLANGADNRLALIWEGENFDTRFYTYRMLAIEVNKFANVLKQFGVRKGDAVAIFTPNLAETAIAVLACFRLGAVFNTVFSGFSTRALRDRLESYGPKVVITANSGLRRGTEIPLKDRVDQAVDGL